MAMVGAGDTADVAATKAYANAAFSLNQSAGVYSTKGTKGNQIQFQLKTNSQINSWFASTGSDYSTGKWDIYWDYDDLKNSTNAIADNKESTWLESVCVSRFFDLYGISETDIKYYRETTEEFAILIQDYAQGSMSTKTFLLAAATFIYSKKTETNKEKEADSGDQEETTGSNDDSDSDADGGNETSTDGTTGSTTYSGSTTATSTTNERVLEGTTVQDQIDKAAELQKYDGEKSYNKAFIQSFNDCVDAVASLIYDKGYYSTWLNVWVFDDETQEVKKDANGKDVVFSSLDPSYLCSLHMSQGKTGVANAFTIKILYAPQPGMDPNALEYLVSSLRIRWQYGYNETTICSPIYEGQVNKYTYTLANNVLTYELKGYSIAASAVEENLTFEQVGVQTADDGDSASVEYGQPATEIACNAFNTALSSYGYKCYIDSDAKGTDDDIYVGEMQNVSVFDYARSVLASAKPKADSEGNEVYASYYFTILDTPANNQIASEDKVSIENGEETTTSTGTKYIIIKRCVFSSATEDTSVTFDWGGGFTNTSRACIVNSFKTEYDGQTAVAFQTATDGTQTEVDGRNVTINWAMDQAGDIWGRGIIKQGANVGDIQTIDQQANINKWWTAVSWAYNATLELVGIPVIVQVGTYLKVNALIYGKRHHTSGLYMVSDKEDSLDSSGYKTTLSLIKVASYETNDLKSALNYTTMAKNFQTKAVGVSSSVIQLSGDEFSTTVLDTLSSGEDIEYAVTYNEDDKTYTIKYENEDGNVVAYDMSEDEYEQNFGDKDYGEITADEWKAIVEAMQDAADALKKIAKSTSS